MGTLVNFAIFGGALVSLIGTLVSIVVGFVAGTPLLRLIGAFLAQAVLALCLFVLMFATFLDGGELWQRPAAPALAIGMFLVWTWSSGKPSRGYDH